MASIMMIQALPLSVAATSATIFCAVMILTQSQTVSAVRTAIVPMQKSDNPLEAVLPGGIAHL